MTPNDILSAFKAVSAESCRRINQSVINTSFLILIYSFTLLGLCSVDLYEFCLVAKADVMLIANAENLMKSVSGTLKAAESASVKVFISSFNLQNSQQVPKEFSF